MANLVPWNTSYVWTQEVQAPVCFMAQGLVVFDLEKTRVKTK